MWTADNEVLTLGLVLHIFVTSFHNSFIFFVYDSTTHTHAPMYMYTDFHVDFDNTRSIVINQI